MNITPKNLIGKRVVDCYEVDKQTLRLEFHDGSAVNLKFDGYFTTPHGTKEQDLKLHFDSGVSVKP